MSTIRRFIIPLILILAPASIFADDKKPSVGFAGVQADGYAVVSVNVAQIWDAKELKPLHAGLSNHEPPWTQVVDRPG